MKYGLLFTITVMLLAACKEQKKPGAEKEMRQITEKPFGTYEGKKVTEYTISNGKGMQVGIINYGGAITKIITPDRDGHPGDVVTGFESLEGFLQPGNPYFGALIGRYGNRIAGAAFTLDGATYTLAANNNSNSLHGGNKGFDKVYWNIEKMAGDSSLRLNYSSADGEEGYPGKLDITVIYTLTSGNELRIEYTAVTDKATPVNLTSHAYFNLSAGADSTILGHQLMLHARAYTPVNDQLIPTGEIKSVSGTPMDFTEAKKIGKDIGQVPGGYDHNWVLDKQPGEYVLAATLYDSASGRMMKVRTTEPGIQFYSGNFLDGRLSATKGGIKYVKHGALCLETQHYPDSPNQPGFPSTILRPGETYTQTCTYTFSTK